MDPLILLGLLGVALVVGALAGAGLLAKRIHETAADHGQPGHRTGH
jgi:hypothetical protein